MASSLQLRAASRYLSTIRANFPVTQERTYLNNAYLHPLNLGAKAAIQAYLERKATGSSRYSYVPARDEAKAHFAQLIHAKPPEISFVPSTTVGENLVVAGLGGTQMKVPTRCTTKAPRTCIAPGARSRRALCETSRRPH